MRGNKLFKFLDYAVGIPLLYVVAFFTQMRKRGEVGDLPPRRILLLKFVALGDAVLLVPAIRNIRHRFPGADITFLGTNLTETFLRQFPEYIDRFITVDFGRLSRNPVYALRTLREIRGLECDVALDFEQWPRISAILIALSRAPFRIGFKTKGQHRHPAFSHPVPRNPEKHEVDNFLALTAALTGEEGTRTLEVKIDDAGLVDAQGFLLKHGWKKDMPVVVIHPGCGIHGGPREWSPRHYAELIEHLASAREAFIAVSGTVSERQQVDVVCRLAGPSVHRFTIESLDSFIALLSLSSLVVSGNNGAMHLAAALQVPQIALHGPTNAKQWGPVNPRAVVVCSGCPGCPCLDLGFEYHRRDGVCMELIDGEVVLQAARGILLS